MKSLIILFCLSISFNLYASNTEPCSCTQPASKALLSQETETIPSQALLNADYTKRPNEAHYTIVKICVQPRGSDTWYCYEVTISTETRLKQLNLKASQKEGNITYSGFPGELEGVKIGIEELTDSGLKAGKKSIFVSPGKYTVRSGSVTVLTKTK